MISHTVEQLVRDIFLQMRNSAVHQRVKENPEAHLLSLLMEIKEDMSGDRMDRVPLHSTVERASFESSIEEARKLEELVLQE